MSFSVPVALLCIKVFLCRILDVSFGTMRTIQIVRGNRIAAAAFGFLETFLWFTVVRQAFSSDLAGMQVAVSYAAGYASGTLVGCYLANTFIKSNICVQAVTAKNDELAAAVRAAGYGASVVELKSSEFGKEKYMFFIETTNDNIEKLRRIIQSKDEKAFIMIHETKSVYNGYFGK